MTRLLTVEEHRSRVLAAVSLLPAETVSLSEASGRTLAEPVLAAHDLPGFDNSSMDGFAVRFADVEGADAEHPASLRVVADLPAGTADDPAIVPGQAARIMTGAAVPADADAIVPFEDTAGGLADSLDTIEVLRAPAAAGAFIRRRGGDTRAGDVVLSAGERLGPFALAAAAAAGVAEVAVRRRPRVAVVSTGSELVAPGDTPTRGQTPDSNATLLAALVAAADADIELVDRVGDDPAGIETVLARASRADVVVFTGGVSAGAYEPVRLALSDRIAFKKVAMQPGKPQAFGALADGRLVFGLPGNPVSVAVSFEVFVRPALLALQGRAVLDRRIARLTASEAWTTPPGRRQYLPAAVDLVAGTARPATAGGSGSHLAASLARAEAFAIVPAEVSAVSVGDTLDVMLIP
ncbi:MULTISPECIES: gephyrin-like molybdotransferase Glp [Microbacterium]|uniref:molybdopterin molybdotransferase MoeA n=1 Tax=Microbacterium TaxID=33882 RepID=UPI002788A9D6|nr:MULTISPECIES: gephyrin-like molybdotransferase Glp [Microbacterium]MDQ1075997.1 molybdopterin molybdotransferase [Microbacterium sp. SORGH_AS_0969]MDQ1116238.1 molybdopterin molybdotransferase [Microbacterium testaceum]